MSNGGAEAELRASEELNRRIIEAVPGGVVHVEPDGSIRTANAEALRILGMHLDEITGKYVADWDPVTLWEDGSHCTQEDYPVTRAMVTGEPQPPVTIGVKRPDGEISWAIFTAVPLHDASGATTGVVVTFLDITERKRAEQARTELEARLVVSDRMASIGTLAAGVAHEINNPLTYMLTNLDWCIRDFSSFSELLGTRLGQVREGAERIRDVVRDLSSFSQLESEGVALDVHEVIESALRMADNEIRYRAQVHRDFGQVPYVHGNHARVGQVILNLLVNAAHSIEPGTPEENEIRVQTESTPQGAVLVRVRDSGSGIEPELLGHIFDPFVTTKKPGQGGGLGLYVSNNIVRALGGDLRVQSELGRGSVFELELPAASPSQIPARDESDSASPDLPHCRLLLVDDEPSILAMLEGHFADQEVVTAANADEARSRMAEQEFDVVICDLVMPGPTGMQLYAETREHDPRLAERFVFMTGGLFTPSAQEFLDGVDNPHVLKPFAVSKLHAAVRRALARKDGERRGT